MVLLQLTDRQVQEKHNCKKSGKGAVLYLCRYRAMYRAMALYLLEKGSAVTKKEISEACHDADISIRMRTVSSR